MAWPLQTLIFLLFKVFQEGHDLNLPHGFRSGLRILLLISQPGEDLGCRYVINCHSSSVTNFVRQEDRGCSLAALATFQTYNCLCLVQESQHVMAISWSF